MEISFALSDSRSEMAALGSVVHTCMAKTPLEVAAGARKLLGVLGWRAECWGHSLGRAELMPGLRKDTATARAPLSRSPGALAALLPQGSLPARAQPTSEGPRGCNLGTALPPCPNVWPQLSTLQAARWCPPCYLGTRPSSSLFVFLAFLLAGSHPPSPELGLCS